MTSPVAGIGTCVSSVSGAFGGLQALFFFPPLLLLAMMGLMEARGLGRMLISGRGPLINTGLEVWLGAELTMISELVIFW